MATKYELPHMGGETISTHLSVKLLKELRTGEYASCERLPSEVELAEHYNVSRTVIRDVLSCLEREGFVERGRGIGTVIHREIVNMTNRLDLKFEFNDLVRGTGYQPSADKVELYEKAADERLAEKLELDVGATLLVVEKRVLASGKPVIYSIDHLPLSLFSETDYRMLDWARPIFDLLEEQSGIAVDTDIANLSATNGTPHIRQMLEVEEGEALIFLEEVGYYKLSRPIIHSYGFYTNFFNFTMLRKKM